MKTFVISLGGSLIVPDKIDVRFIKRFCSLVINHVEKGKRFVIVCGGGKTSRIYQNCAKKISNPSFKELDELGILTTKLNAYLIKTAFSEYASRNILDDPRKTIRFDKRVVLACGWKPGFSTDYDAVVIAKNLKTGLVINLTNVDYVYDKNPLKYRDARPIKKVSWDDMLNITGKQWKPGLHVPFDPKALKLAAKHKIRIVITNGRKIKNLDNLLNEKSFVGTVIG